MVRPAPNVIAVSSCLGWCWEDGGPGTGHPTVPVIHVGGRVTWDLMPALSCPACTHNSSNGDAQPKPQGQPHEHRCKQTPFGHRGSSRSSRDPGQGLGTHLGGRVPLRWGLWHPLGGDDSYPRAVCAAQGDHSLPATLTGRLKTQEQGGLRLTEALSVESWMAPVCTCGAGAAKIISVNEHVLQHVSSSPGALFVQQIGGGWTRAKETRGQAGLCVGLCKES